MILERYRIQSQKNYTYCMKAYLGTAVFGLRIKPSAELTAAAIANGLSLGYDHRLAGLGMNRGVLRTDMHAKDTQRRNLDPVVFEQVGHQLLRLLAAPPEEGLG